MNGSLRVVGRGDPRRVAACSRTAGRSSLAILLAVCSVAACATTTNGSGAGAGTSGAAAASTSPATSVTTSAATSGSLPSASGTSTPVQPTYLPPPGSYSGLTSQGRPLSFYVSADSASIQDISIPTVGLSCTPGGANAFDHLAVASATVTADGSFSATTNQAGAFAGFPAKFSYSITGNFQGAGPGGALKAAGSFRETITYTDAAAARTCTSDDQTWSGTLDAHQTQPTSLPEPGSYSGLTSQGRPLSFDVSTDRASVQNMSIPAVGLSCTPGGANAFDQLAIASAAAKADGSFSAAKTRTGVFAGFPARFTYSFTGTFHGAGQNNAPRAAGSFRETITYTDTLAARTCTSDDQTWSVTRSA